MTQPLFWLTLTALFVTLMWVPYVLNSFAVRGVIKTMNVPSDNDTPLAAWAQRAKKAHINALESLAPFAALVIVAHLIQTDPTAVGNAAVVFFFARLAHYVAYTLAIPYIRTISFIVGFGAQLVIVFEILNHAA